MSNVTNFRDAKAARESLGEPPAPRRVSNEELHGMRIGAQLNASFMEGPNKTMWQNIANVMVELEERRAAEHWSDSRG